MTDGTGGLIFLKTLTAEYLSQKYGIQIPAERGVLGRLEDPDPEELEDSFLRYAGQITASRKEQTAYHLSGTPEPDGFLDLTTLMLPVDAVKAKAKEFGVSVTEFIAAVMMKAISDLQTGEGAAADAPPARQGPVAGQPARAVPEQDASELRVLCDAGDRPAAGRLFARGDLQDRALPHGSGERRADDGRQDRHERRERTLGRAAGDAAVYQKISP